MRIHKHTDLEVYDKGLYAEYDAILGMVVTMISKPESWILPSK